MSTLRDLSHGSSKGDEVHPPDIILPTLLNHNTATFNFGNSSSYSAAGGVTVGNTDRRSIATPCVHPRGSMDRPKGENIAMKPVTLEVPAGVDIIDWVAGFANSNKVCVTIVGGFGKVSLAILRNLVSQAPPLLYEEHLTLISLSGTCLLSPLAKGYPTFFNASLGRVNGGVIAGAALRMVTMGKVGLSAYVFQNPKIITFVMFSLDFR